MTVTPAWERPSARVAELIRTGVAGLLEASESAFDQVDAVTLANADPAVIADPALVAAIRRTNRANLTRWAEANLHDPGAPVAPNVGPETLGIARDLVRRGLDASTLDAYRTGQNAAWRLWMAAAFTLTSDPDELSELLDVTANSIFTFVDATIAAIGEQVSRERERLRSGTHAERLEIVTLILEGAPIRQDRAAARLNYALDRRHTAAIVFTNAAEPDQVSLEAAAEALAQAAGARRPLTVIASASALWVWVSGEHAPDLDALRVALDALPEVRIALGPTGAGIEGFRRSHLDAIDTQRLLQRNPGGVRVASYDDVQVVALSTRDEDRAQAFVERTLGPLATAAPELLDTLRTYLAQGSNAKRTAAVTFTHRNTVLRRLERAEQLLPAPLEDRLLPVALALEITRWIGARPVR
ncbi:MAG: PucR family transcriptional regulator [Solirubrobacteraceae bacterium]